MTTKPLTVDFLQSFVNLDLTKMNIVGTDIRSAKQMCINKTLLPNTVLFMFMPREYSTNSIIPSIGAGILFLGVVANSKLGITSDNLLFKIGSEKFICKNYNGFLRHTSLPIDMSKITQKIRVGVSEYTDMLEIAFFVAPKPI